MPDLARASLSSQGPSWRQPSSQRSSCGGLFTSALLAGGLLLGSGHRLVSWWMIETRSLWANTNPSRNKL
jgi:hypothetical protein